MLSGASSLYLKITVSNLKVTKPFLCFYGKPFSIYSSYLDYGQNVSESEQEREREHHLSVLLKLFCDLSSSSAEIKFVLVPQHV